MADLPLKGSCLCGRVRFEVTEPPVTASYCHCTRCQKRTGTAASAQVRIVPGSLNVLSGEELLRALWSSLPDTGEPVGIRMAAFDDDPGVRPAYRQFVAYAAEWEPIPDDGLPRHPERTPPQPS